MRLAGRVRRHAHGAGLFWPIPITLSAAAPRRRPSPSRRVALLDPDDGSVLATMLVTEKYAIDKAHEWRASSAPRTPSTRRADVMNQASEPRRPREVYSDALQAKYVALHDAGGNARGVRAPRLVEVAAFQTRNPMHRSHEYLAKVAIEVVRRVLIHSLLATLKPATSGGGPHAGDRLAHGAYFVARRWCRRATPDMRYAGPREALLHALFRQNYGCSHRSGPDTPEWGAITALRRPPRFDRSRLARDAALQDRLDFWSTSARMPRRVPPHGDEDRLLVVGNQAGQVGLEAPSAASSAARGSRSLRILRTIDAKTGGVKLHGHSGALSASSSPRLIPGGRPAAAGELQNVPRVPTGWLPGIDRRSCRVSGENERTSSQPHFLSTETRT